jgi:tetratricopeptide (TPR) repeat protein
LIPGLIILAENKTYIYYSTAMMAQSNNQNSTNSLEKQLSNSSGLNQQVRVIGISEYAQAAECLAEAFAIDEVARYFIDTDDMISYSEEYKYKLHCDIMRYITAAHCYKGIVTTIGSNYDAVALWYVSSYPLFSLHFHSLGKQERKGPKG